MAEAVLPVVAGTTTEVAVTTPAVPVEVPVPIPEFVASSGPYVMWLTLIIFNLAAIVMLRIVFNAVDLADALREKNVQQAPVNQQGDANAAGAAPSDASFSRLAGAVGAMILACFIWALGNVILFNAFGSVDQIAKLLSQLGSFFLAASALFAPYAFNQLGDAFKPAPKQ